MEKTGLKILVHSSAFYFPFLVPFVVFLFIDDLEIKKLAIQAILFQLVMGALIFVSFLLIFVIIGIPLIIGFSIMWFVVPIIGIVKAINNVEYNYPIVGLWVR
ncbi:DUF4870 domain-containing protein [Sporosarcina sp. G11-34]|uniref:DUF4870 domain-containing protein n=1 Tax=Sporosarcina sp. G11-34 TaxID=2849605 RepID=UPI0022A8F274|nr:DUF4870 domain-containing protein [Sporosarcina sp. G11-34]MCZ2257888.1 DUF4870 domain-containing protein [Sporosarcina sp. G11-34]